MRLILRPFILFFLFIFAYSSQVATLNIYTNHNDNNICKSDEKNNNLECISHCCLTQFDNFNYSSIFLSSYEQINETLINLFSKHRIVFWYDNKYEMLEEFQELKLEILLKISVVLK